MKRIVEDLYISDQYDAENDVLLDEHGIDLVVTLCSYRNPSTDIHHPLVDGEDSQPQFDHAVELIDVARDGRTTVLVHCTAGISRSVAVVATVLATTEGLEFDDALERIERVHERADPEPGLRTHAERYLGD